MMKFPIVFKRGNTLICEGCGNTISLSVNKYDDVMHSVDCKRKRLLDALAAVPHMSDMICRVSNQSMTDISPKLARVCPAHRMLFNIIGLSAAPGIDCDSTEECYQRWFQQYEDIVLKAAEIME